MLRNVVVRKAYSTQIPKQNTTRESWLYIDSVYPIQIARWDIRHYIALLRQENLLSSLQSRLEQLSSVQNFKPIEIHPYPKDGGVFVHFSYSPTPSGGASDESITLERLENELREEVDKNGPLPSWLGPLGMHLRMGSLWLVKGVPWREDMNRFASPILKLAFEGPDIQEQALYELCRPYGRIRDLIPPTPAPTGSLRSSTITFHRLHAATVARNVIHGLTLESFNDSSTTTQTQTQTRIRAQYQHPLQVHAVRDWISTHPRITLPVIVFLLGTLTYTIFDPIRALMIEAKMLDWFDYRQFRIYQWLRTTTLGRILNNFDTAEPSTSTSTSNTSSSTYLDSTKGTEGVWQERNEAESSIKTYLSDIPSTIAFIHGPQGSGKSSLLTSILQSTNRNSLVIDLKPVKDAPSDSALVASLAKQTGYWPVFSFLSSASNLVDLASVGVLGQKAGVSTSTSDQLRQILSVVTSALKSVSSSHRRSIQRAMEREERRRLEGIETERCRKEILQGSWHDGRIDCVAGNGVMSELGVGVERFESENEDGNGSGGLPEKQEQERPSPKTREDGDVIRSLPIVVLKNYGTTSTASAVKEEMLIVLSQWAAALAENQIAHVIVLSDNRENMKRLAKALPSKPLHSIALSDADTASSLSFVKQKLRDSGRDVNISGQETKYVERLGGRASDLESLIHKVRSGMFISEAVEDIITRGVAELRKNAFGDDAEDAKTLPWTREQAWKVLKLLVKKPEVGYFELLVDFPFKGEEGESALRSMEHAELIAISTKDGRPENVRPGKPVFRYVFERVVSDRVFEATQELAYNKKEIKEAEGKIKVYEEELSVLMDTMAKEEQTRRWWGRWLLLGFFGRSDCRSRARYVGEKLAAAEKKVEKLEWRNRQWKRVIIESR